MRHRPIDPHAKRPALQQMFADIPRGMKGFPVHSTKSGVSGREDVRLRVAESLSASPRPIPLPEGEGELFAPVPLHPLQAGL